MWIRKRIDIGWSDLGCGLFRSIVPGDRHGLQTRLERAWSPSDDALACLSVRSGWDLLLAGLALPAGSEVLMSAITIPDMSRIVAAHGLRAVPVDVCPRTAAPTVEGIRRVLTPVGRAILVAHLFGTRIDLDPIVEFSRQQGLVLIEDAAQLYDGSGDTGHPGALASMYSFGPIKTSTALGGALLRVRDRDLLSKIRGLQQGYRVAARGAYARRVFKYLLFKSLSYSLPFAALVRGCRLVGLSYDQLLNTAARGFPGAAFFERIRRQPSAPLLAVMNRRLASFDSARLARRAALGRNLTRMLDGRVTLVGDHSLLNHYWVFPILVAEPSRLIDALARAGFDATQGRSLSVVEPPSGRADAEPSLARRLLAQLVYLPCYPEMDDRELARLAEVVKDHCGARVVWPDAAPRFSPGAPLQTTVNPGPPFKLEIASQRAET